MDIKLLKEKILKNTLGNAPLCFTYTDNKYLIYEYVNAIAQNKSLHKIFIDSLKELDNNDALFDSDVSDLFILDVEEFTENLKSQYENLIIICKKIADTSIKIDITEFPKLLPWQIEDYVKARLPGLSELEIGWLCEVSQYNIYRLDQECKKLELFNQNSQKIIFQEINFDNGYSDLNSMSIFNFTNALLKKDRKLISSILSDLMNIDVEGTGVVTILLRQFKNLIDIQTNPRNTAASLKITEKQFKAISYNKNKFSDKQLIDIYEFLTSIDCRLKQGELTFYDTATHLVNNNALVDYITINLLKLSM